MQLNRAASGNGLGGWGNSRPSLPIPEGNHEFVHVVH
jgi:hypothetical protein